MRSHNLDRQRRHLLLVSWWLPHPAQAWGGAIRTYHLLRHLAARYDMTLLAYGGPEAREHVASLASLATVRLVPPPATLTGRKRIAQARSLLQNASFDASRLWSAAMQQAIDEVVGGTQPDAILVELSQMAHFRFPAGPCLIVDEQNIEFELHRRVARIERSLARRAFNWIEAIKIRREELRVWRRSDTCLVTSEREAAIIRTLVPSARTVVVPNGVDADYFQPGHSLPRDAATIVFTGRMSYRPNADAAVYFTRQVLPVVRRRRPEVILYLVGQDPPPEVQRLVGPGVVVTGRVADVRPFLARATAVVAPVRAGSGTRIKILEALAMGKAVVATSLACEGLLVEGDRHLLLADSAPRFAEQVWRLLDDPVLAARVGLQGRALVERSYEWAVVFKNLDNVLDALPTNRHERAPWSLSARASAVSE